ncbi:MAG TPA: hypothetical protein VGK37_04055 [Casimicrobiaceae bacterium]|jgi:hypothetical protein
MSKTPKPKAKAAKKTQGPALPVGAMLVLNVQPAAAVYQFRPASAEMLKLWAGKEYWTLAQAACLLARLVPDAPREALLDIANGGQSAHILGDLKNSTWVDKTLAHKEVAGWVGNWRITPADCIRWAKVRQGLNVPAELEQVGQSRHWIRQDTKAEVARRETMTRAQIVDEYQGRIDDGARVLERTFDDHGNPKKAGDIDVVPLRVVYSDTGKEVRGYYVKELIRAHLEPLCNRPRVSAYAPGVSGKPQVWAPVKQPRGNRGKSSGNDDD